ncbi:uncharacterized protein K444DRAFT_530641, partial [Hyaloscypha bicolor E]
MSAERGETLPLILSTSSSQFPQQGQVDWSNLSKNTVEFTVDVLSRLSKAGIEALTVYATKVLFSHAKLDQLGEQRILDALKAVKAFSSHSNVVWFGFGIKNILRSLSETQQGIACIGICSCLTEEFSTEKSAQILGELFQLYNPPADLRPSLRQWHAIVSSCEGVVTTTNFGFVLSGLARICLLDGHNGLYTSSKPKDLAHVLKGLFDVSNGTLDKIHISGGSDCAWIAAVGHWLFGLQVVVEDASGNIIYRPGGIRSATRHDPQVPLCLVRLIYVLCSLIQLSSQIIFQKDLVVCPTLNGMNRLYMMTRPTMPNLHTMGLLFNGRVDFDPLDFAQKHTCASAADGVCIYLNSVCEISSDPQRACLIHIVPGRIEWNNFSYH